MLIKMLGVKGLKCTQLGIDHIFGKQGFYFQAVSQSKIWLFYLKSFCGIQSVIYLYFVK